jgi:hypothetical protein
VAIISQISDNADGVMFTDLKAEKRKQKGVVRIGRAPLWSTGESLWIQIQRSGFDSRRYQIFWEVVGLERGPFSLMSKIEELLGRNSSGSGLEIREYDRRDPSRWPRGTLYQQKLALTSPTNGGRSVGLGPV